MFQGTKISELKSEVMMNTAIVTGVAGFIGSHLAERLLENKFKVIGIDSFTNYYSKKIKENNLVFCLKNTNFTLVKEDLINTDLVTIFKKGQYLFHIAAQPGVRTSWGKQFKTYVKDNLLVTQRILECAKYTNSFKKIVIASSSSVYGEQVGKMNEETTRLLPVSPYGVSKLAAENLSRIYAENFELPITSLRYFTVYGPKQRPEMAFMRFIVDALSNHSITIYGDGNQTRDFTYIGDVISATVATIENDTRGGILNIGGGQAVSINNVIKILEDLLGSRLTISYKSKQKGDVTHTESDISKATQILNYKPSIKIKNGLLQQIKYVKNNLALYTKFC